MNDDLNAAKGILVGTAVSLVIWAAFFAAYAYGW